MSVAAAIAATATAAATAAVATGWLDASCLGSLGVEA
jgi:hypothetical protein